MYPDCGYRYPDVKYRYLDVAYRYLDARHRYLDVRCRYSPMSDIGTRMSDRIPECQILAPGSQISYQTSNIGIGHRIYRSSGVILSETAPHSLLQN